MGAWHGGAGVRMSVGARARLARRCVRGRCGCGCNWEFEFCGDAWETQAIPVLFLVLKEGFAACG